MKEKPEALRLALEALELWRDNFLYAAEIERLKAKNERLRGLLLRIRAWDHLDGAADGLFWKREIEQVLQEVPR